ncbi:tyrosine-protein phosphatase [Cohnella herbarum]|uniref:Tyrosine-protein phosphatase n=1 Tax=Cohnella herbarum TaxID=2728023 RepID=A0A7Z2VMB5_9BACL|nr:tyrosine-protein phosphatase [Cohnella herbarum]QJD85455.1 tyrosine-protein phosphatase [Cohnella herbarum]
MSILTAEQRQQRIVKLDGAFNMRDLGGYSAENGRTTRWGRFFRADGLHKLTHDDKQRFAEREVRTVVDLRHAQELERSPNVFAGSGEVAYHNVDLINPAAVSRPLIRSLGDMYVGMLDDSQASLRQVFELLALETEDAAVYHCAAGKDRTGVVSGILLDLAGVSAETIVNDYKLTAECIAPIMDELRQGKPEAVPEEIYERFLGCDGENMVMMLDHLHTRYGGAGQYLLAIGLAKEQVEGLKRKLLED